MRVTWGGASHRNFVERRLQTLCTNVKLMQAATLLLPAPPPKQVRRKVMVTRIYMLGSKVNTKTTTDFGEDE